MSEDEKQIGQSDLEIVEKTAKEFIESAYFKGGPAVEKEAVTSEMMVEVQKMAQKGDLAAVPKLEVLFRSGVVDLQDVLDTLFMINTMYLQVNSRPDLAKDICPWADRVRQEKENISTLAYLATGLKIARLQADATH